MVLGLVLWVIDLGCGEWGAYLIFMSSLSSLSSVQLQPNPHISSCMCTVLGHYGFARAIGLWNTIARLTHFQESFSMLTLMWSKPD